MSTGEIAILMFPTLLIVVVIFGIHVSFAVGGIAVIFGFFAWGLGVFPAFMARISELMSSYILAAIPLFLFMGNMIEASGAADALFESIHELMGPIKGGLAIGSIIICTLFAAATGIIGASVTTMTLIALPAMVKRGYSKELATGTVMAGGCLGILIPPSVMLVVYGPAANLSVGKLYMAALIPGLILSSLYVLYVAIRAYLQPHLAPALQPDEIGVPLSRKLLRAVTSLLPTLFLILMCLGTIFAGVATPTEAAALGALGSIILAAGYRNLNLRVLKIAIERTVIGTGMIYGIVLAASCFTSVFIGLGGGEVVAGWLRAMPSRWGAFGTTMFMIFLLGFFLDWLGSLLIMLPVYNPILSSLGFDPLFVALCVAVCFQTSFLTPPFAPAIFYLKGIAPPELGIELNHLYRAVVPYIILQLIGLMLVIIFPQLILWLPNLMIR